MTSTIFYECIDGKLISGAIGDLIQCIAAFPLAELPKLPAFSLGWNQKAYLGNGAAVRVQTDRQTLLDFLRSIERLYAGYRHLLQEEYRAALGAFLTFPGYANTEGVFASAQRITAALTDKILLYYLQKGYGQSPENPWGGKHDYDPETDSGDPYAGLRHYQEYRLDLPATQVIGTWGYALAEQIGAFLDGIGRLYNFCLPMLRAEAHRGLGDANAADQIYADLLAGTPGKSEGLKSEFFVLVPLAPEDNELVRLRRGLNYVEWGDRCFAQAHGLAAAEEATLVQSAKSKYEAAIAILAGLYPSLDHEVQMIQAQIKEVDAAYQTAINALEEVPPGGGTWGLSTPAVPGGAGTWGLAPPSLAREIISQAAAQLTKIAGRLNYLGYYDAFVPPQRYLFLWGRAREYADLAVDAEMRYLHFRHLAESEELQTRVATQGAQMAGFPAQIAQLQWETEEARLVVADRKIADIDRRLAALQETDIWGFLFGYVEMWGNVYQSISKADAMGAVKAMATWFRGNFTEAAQRDTESQSLLAQKSVLDAEKAVTERQRLIAALQKMVAEMRAQQIRETQEYLETKELNSDTYHALACALKRIVETYLVAAIQMSYLAERALNLEMGVGNIRLIRFDYYRPDIKDLLAGDLLRQDLMLLDLRRSLFLKQRNHIKHVISLRRHYPVEFYELVSKGKTSFATTLYEFDKEYPGTYGHRLRKVDVAIDGPVGPDGFKGSLTNSGFFQVRSVEGSLSSTRLVPTLAEWKSAYKEFLKSGAASVEVGGIRSYQLPEARLILSQYQAPGDGSHLPADAEVRDIFEDFGVAGLWHLELPPELNDADYKELGDVLVTLEFDAGYDPRLEEKMLGSGSGARGSKGLIKEYEEELTKGKLDRIGMLSLRTCFPKEFGELAQGEMLFTLAPEHFPSNVGAKAVQKVLIVARNSAAQAVAGLKLHVEHGEGLSVDLTTLKNGLTESLQPASLFAPQVTRKTPLTGKWKISVADHAAGAKVHDLFLFFWYEYNERKVPT